MPSSAASRTGPAWCSVQAATIRATVSGEVLRGIRCGREERSARPASLADVLHRRLLLCLVMPSTRPRVMDQPSPGDSCASLDAATGTGRLRRTSR